MPKTVWLNGEIMPLEEAKISVADHAHLYGDGLFEGIRIYGRKIFRLDEHLKRLFNGCNYLGFKMSMDFDALRAKVIEVAKKADISDGYIRLNVTRGTGLGLDPSHINDEPNVMIMISELSLYPKEAYDRGLDVVMTSFKVIPADALDPRIKCIGRYAANIMAKREANMAGAGEGLMLNHQGHIAEATGDNLFLVQDGVLRTPHPSCGILNGITRQTVIKMAREDGVEVREENLTIFDIFTADEAFLTGTAAEVIPMISLDQRPVGSGKPGDFTKKMIARYREVTKTGVAFD